MAVPADGYRHADDLASEDTGALELVVKNTFLTLQEPQILRRSQSWSSSSHLSENSSSSHRDRPAAAVQQLPEPVSSIAEALSNLDRDSEHVIFPATSSSSSAGTQRSRNVAGASSSSMAGPGPEQRTTNWTLDTNTSNGDDELLRWCEGPEGRQAEARRWRDHDHELGQCRPCKFFVKEGCEQGQSCRYCHLPHEKKSRIGRRARPSKHARQQCREMKQMLEENLSGDPQLRDQIASELAKTNKYFGRLARWNDTDPTALPPSSSLQPQQQSMPAEHATAAEHALEAIVDAATAAEHASGYNTGPGQRPFPPQIQRPPWTSKLSL